MKKLYIAVVISVVLKATGAIGQGQKTEKVVPAKSPDAPANTDGMKCCEGMEKMGEMKAGVPMTGDVKSEIKPMMGKCNRLKT